MAPERGRFSGKARKLVMAFDVGTTYSGVSYAVLNPGLVPEIHRVTRFPAQQRVGGDSKIPTILYYDKEGALRAVGAEATQDEFLEEAEDNEYVKVEWFKLHLRPRALGSSHIRDDDIPPLPQDKTAEEILGDFLNYLYTSTQKYIKESHPAGTALWKSIENSVEYVLSIPNGWEGSQQAQMRRAVIKAGLVANDAQAQDRISFVTEGEASLHYCIRKSITVQPGEGLIIVDCGSDTIDVRAYLCKSPRAFEEIAGPQCRLEGSAFVSRRARKYLQDKLKDSKFKDKVEHMAGIFDKTAKLSFRDPAFHAFIRFGTSKDNDLTADIRLGQMKIAGEQMESLFQPSLEAILTAVEHQRSQATVPIKAVFLVGEFAAHDYLFTNLQKRLEGVQVSRPDGHLNKVVADGAVSFYLDRCIAVPIICPSGRVPSLANLPSIQRPQASASNVSSRRRAVDLSEGCFVTKTLKYTHQLSYWINAVEDGDPEPIEDLFEEVLCVTPAVFTLDQPCNFAFLESFVHTALDVYAFIAITASLSTLNGLIEMVQSDNDRRKLAMNDNGIDIRRSLDFDSPSFTKPEYELVALHPEHFLPLGNMLTVYDAGTATYKHYVAASDRYLRESPHPSSPRLPAFHHVSEDREPTYHRLNVFLVIINAEVKFRRYFAMAQPTTPLPADVINLMHRTIHLVDLLYWQPEPEPGSWGAKVVAKRLASRCKNTPRAKRLDPEKIIERESSEQRIEDDDQEMQFPSGFHMGSSRRSRLRWLADVDLETRMAYGRALMSGQDRAYDPALFEDAIPSMTPVSTLRKRL